MPTQISNSAFAASIAHDEPFNAYQDIVWSLQYALCGANNAQGGFCTFLYDAAVATLTGGGIGASLGYAPSSGYNAFASISGLSGGVLGIGFDTHGLFAASGNGKDTGVAANNVASLTIRTGSTFVYLTTIALSALDSSYALMSSALAYETLRFRLHSAGSFIEIARFDGDAYKVLLDYPVSLNVATSSFYKVGVSYAAPLCGNAPAAKFAIKNFHVEGFDAVPVVSVPAAPFVYQFPVIQNLSIESPQSIPLKPLPTTMLGGAYAAIEPPVPEAVACPNLCLDPFVLVFVLDQTASMGTRSAQFALQVLAEHTNAVKKVSIISFGNIVCPQVITFNDSVSDAQQFLLEAAKGGNAFYCDAGGAEAPENGIDALYLAATILRDYNTTYKKYVYFITDTADFANNTYGAFTVNQMLNDYADAAWMNIGSSVTDENTKYSDYITESPVVKYDYFPSCPALPFVYCDTPVRGAGARGTYNFAFDAGSQTGPYSVTYSAASAAPARFSVIWGPNISSSCFIGSQTYNAALTALGYAAITTTALTGTLAMTKGNATPSSLKIVVETPFDDAEWQFAIKCYGA
jgi:hypothetical protein